LWCAEIYPARLRHYFTSGLVDPDAADDVCLDAFFAALAFALVIFGVTRRFVQNRTLSCLGQERSANVA
jgi:hypothetical protein